MASPFDFSAFLLTPPIPNYSNNYSTSGNNDAQNRQQFNEPNSTDGGPNDYSQNPSNPVPTQSYPTSINAYGGQRQESLSQSHTAFPPQSNNDTYQPVQQSQQNSALYLSPDQRGSDAQSNYGSYNPSSFSTFQEPMNNQQMYSSSVPSTAVNSAQTTSNNLPPVASGSNPKRLSMSAANMPSLDERDYGLDPSAFSNVTFQMPSFLQATTQPGEYGDGPPVVDPSAFRSAQPQGMSIFQPGFLSGPTNPGQHVTQSDTAPPNVFQQKADSARKSVSAATANQKKQYVPDPKNPVYGIYGSSVISVNPDPSPFKLALNNAIQPKLTAPSESRSGSPDFDPKSLGLPVGDQLFPQALPGLYSSSGFDMLGVLARVVARPNPQINIGPVDTSCSFLVVDARRYDMPIVFASDTFSKLTGYHNADIIGRNCRFLQAPDGNVPMGSRRKYTDPAAVYHLKTHIQSGKETQASIINYRKDGSPFINLVTVIPISWDTDEIAYFVGFQVDLVEQPNAILEKMRNGTYVVNYSLLPTNSGVLPAVPALAAEKPDIPEEQPLVEEPMYVEPRTIQMSYTKASGAATAAAAQSSMTIAPELLEVMGALGTGDELDDDAAKKRWNKMLLDHTGDFVHVLSLKGSFLYVSPSVTSMLEYEPSDLVGKTLQSVCHPSDIVPVMRELKDSSNASQQVINLLYRFRRKHSGYIWLEAQGKLYLEQSKSRKCVILVGRERPVYQLSWQDLRAAGGLGEKEYWSKITVNGMFLYNTPSVRSVVGHEAQNLQGKSMFDYIDASKAPELAIALNDARAGKSVRMRYKLKNARGSWVDVITNFFPNMTPSSMDGKRGRTSTHPTIVLQTNEYASEMRRRATMGSSSGTLPFPTGVTTSGDRDGQRRPTLLQSSSYRDMVVTTPDASDDGSSSGSASGSGSGSDSSAPSTFSAIPSTYKTLLSQAKTQSDNLFDELDTTRTTSWQYELHQLKLTNKKLKEELAMLEAAKRKRKKKDLSGNNESSTSAASSRVPLPASNPNGKTCANCGRTDSPEWRVGPSGSRNLCNACGLRWAKATRNQRQSSSTPSGSASSSGNSDMEAAASYLQPVGPFALHRPPFQHAESSRFNQSGH